MVHLRLEVKNLGFKISHMWYSFSPLYVQISILSNRKSPLHYLFWIIHLNLPSVQFWFCCLYLNSNNSVQCLPSPLCISVRPLCALIWCWILWLQLVGKRGPWYLIYPPAALTLSYSWLWSICNYSYLVKKSS